ncbi:MAG TPA: hypothetical protein VIC61_07185 [Gammaproteobacteria bacterium]|jgi:hypothetical protein
MKMLKIGGVILVIGTLPLLIYILVGPEDGNPIGLGLLMMASWLLGGVFVLVGAVRAAIDRKGDRT